ncbi:MAG: malto-oligosyltrehalose synthase [Myxacorys chilensis ATA2-1-KO14]|jgi:(1->4)-alpha-D-glucan 1-alpha-D-glucosylmutase|nr:malto-oligosyltrehalose synthase [Myxacorys chilensis ATA2-1-KO14]
MRIPTATYRIQFNSNFRFDQANQIVNYLAQLGVSDLYASPIFKATTGSTHGYDVVDPTQLNPELGTRESFDALVKDLQQHEMGWLQDIVPNHMAYSSENQWLMDLLENGVNSDYVAYFDVAWNSPFESSDEAILVPLLGNFYGQSLENGEIQLKYDQNGLSVNYYSLSIPLNLESYGTFLTHNLGKLAKALGRREPNFIKLLGILYLVKNVASDITGKQRQDQVEFVKGLLWELYSDNAEVRSFVDENIQAFNGETSNSESFNLLDNLLSQQFFRLAYWKVGAEEINYRRFFTVNELISVKVDETKVFNHTHDLIAQLVKDGAVTGLRIDHIDGLYDPTQYLHSLREKVGDTYVTVEKILQPGEDLPSVWDTQGTSGYDYLNYVNSVFCKTKNQEQFDEIYQNLIGFQADFEKVVSDKKGLIIDKNLAGDIDNLAFLLKKISGRYRYGNDFTINGLKRAIAEVLTRFSIYRTYTTAEGVLDSDRPYIQDVIQNAKEQASLLNNELNFIEKLLLLDYDSSLTQTEKEQWLYFVMRVQQYTGPLMAKGVEDTAFYVYNRLISLNEVGGDPDRFGIAIAEFHGYNQYRQAHWSNAMSATSSHDTKRGEDVRARINVLSEIPDEWQQQLRTWLELNRKHKTKVKNVLFPDRNDEYALYQTLIGAFPFLEQEQESFTQRAKDYLLKAIREAKVYTAWLRPNAAYEDACMRFVDAVLEPSEENPFLQSLLPFQKKVAFYGIFNSLSQALLKITSPGIPDFYQGCELWDLSLVDPDNRRPVDFEQRQAFLDDIQQRIQSDISSLVTELLETKEDGRIKLFLTVQALKARTKYLSVFQKGSYQPLEVEGALHDHVIAFARSEGSTTLITVVPRFLTAIVQPGEHPLGTQVWSDTKVKLPARSSSGWQDAITGQIIQHDEALPVGDVLSQFPVALLVSRE